MTLPNLSGISAVVDVETRSISAENPTGERGQGGRRTEGTGAHAARDLGVGWKVSPSIEIAAGETVTLADITGSGAITHIWLTTHSDNWRRLILRAHWDGDEAPAIEAPVGDFFCSGWGRFAQVNSLPISVNPNGGFNSYWEMPFRSQAQLTIENTHDEPVIVYFQVDYWLGAVADGSAYLHAQWRRSNPLQAETVHTLLDGVSGPGHYVGTYLAWGVNSTGWWGEGEVKFYLDDDEEFPTICGTGTEDYFGGAWNFDLGEDRGGYTEFSTPYLGLPQIIRPDGQYQSQQRFGMYRFHLPDPIRFRSKLRVDVQALGWRSGGRYLPLQDDIASTAFFYSTATSTTRPPALTHDVMEIC